MSNPTRPESYASEFCARLMAARVASGLSPQDLAASVGLDADTYAQFESGMLLPHHLMVPFVEATGANLTHLLSGRVSGRGSSRRASTVEADIARCLPRRPAALVMDFDGVFTDNRVIVDQDGREAVLCNRSDGLGMERLKGLGLPLLVLSKERNPVVRARCNKLGIECLQGVEDKGPALVAWCDRLDLKLADTVFVGNDINDLPCLELVGCAVAVADAYDEVLAVADVVLRRPGGFGALRELADALRRRMLQG